MRPRFHFTSICWFNTNSLERCSMILQRHVALKSSRGLSKSLFSDCLSHIETESTSDKALNFCPPAQISTSCVEQVHSSADCSQVEIAMQQLLSRDEHPCLGLTDGKNNHLYWSLHCLVSFCKERTTMSTHLWVHLTDGVFINAVRGSGCSEHHTKKFTWS